jgi:hypothetical protein
MTQSAARRSELDWLPIAAFEPLIPAAARGVRIMNTLRVLSYLGDKVYTWDPARATTGDPEAVAAVREAERIFAAARSGGATAFRLAPGRVAERLEVFAPEAEQIVIVPRITGGRGS